MHIRIRNRKRKRKQNRTRYITKTEKGGEDGKQEH